MQEILTSIALILIGINFIIQDRKIRALQQKERELRLQLRFCRHAVFSLLEKEILSQVDGNPEAQEKTQTETQEVLDLINKHED